MFAASGAESESVIGVLGYWMIFFLTMSGCAAVQEAESAWNGATENRPLYLGEEPMIVSQKLIEGYRELKKEVPDCILMMQVGAFMQAMGEDAKRVSQVTGLKLKMGGNVESPVVIGGFPQSGLDKYVGKLVRGGFSVAIAVQDGEKRRTIGEVVRIATPEKG